MKDILHLYIIKDEVFFSLVPHASEGYMINSEAYKLSQIDDLTNDLLEFVKGHINLEKSLVVFLESTSLLVSENNLPKMPPIKAGKIVSNELKDIIPSIEKYTLFNYFTKTKKGYLNIKSILVETEVIKLIKKLSKTLKMEPKVYFTYSVQNQKILDNKNSVFLKKINNVCFISLTYNNITRELTIPTLISSSLIRAIDSLFASFMLNKTDIASLRFIYMGNEEDQFILPSDFNWENMSLEDYLKISTKNILVIKGLKI